MKTLRHRFCPAIEPLEARQVLSVTYNGGSLLAHVEVESLFLGTNWYNDATLNQQTGALDGYLQTITSGSYMDMLAQAGYGVGRGQFLDGIIDRGNLSTTIADGSIQAQIQSMIDGGYLQSPDSNRLYFVYVQPGVEVTSGNEDSIHNFLGYHSSWWGHDRLGNATDIRYAVIPYSAAPNATIRSLSNPFDVMTVVSSHELSEAVTDPDPNNGWYDATWWNGSGYGGEIGDIVNQQYVRWDGYMVQKEAGQNEQALTPPGTLTAQGQPVTPTTGQTLNGVVATLSDGDSSELGNPYQVQINWGNGQTSGGNLVYQGNGTFQVVGANVYVQPGTYTITVTITSSDGASATAVSTATVNRPLTPPPAGLGIAANALSHSAEYYANFITAAYERYLQRQPDGPGLGAWVLAMQHGLTDEQLEAGFIGSAEYIQDHGGLGAGWITGLYQNLLGRTPAPSEVSGWLAALRQGMMPGQVALGFAASAEREGQRVTADYQRYLGRTPSPGEVAGWVNAFLHGASNEDVVAGFVGSPEYYDQHGGDAADWLTSAYQDLLGRQPDGAGMQGWLAFLGA